MIWPWRRRAPDVAEAQQHIDHIRKQQPEVDRLEADAKRARQRNHFQELIMQALRGAR